MNEPAPRREPVLLLDSNLLIALSIEDHVHREPARRWLAATAQRFATCPITQGALVRSWLRLGGEIQTARQAVAVLAAHDRHEFWTDDVSYVEVPMAGIVGHRQVTDAYLAHRPNPSRSPGHTRSPTGRQPGRCDGSGAHRLTPGPVSRWPGAGSPLTRSR